MNSTASADNIKPMSRVPMLIPVWPTQRAIGSASLSAPKQMTAIAAPIQARLVRLLMRAASSSRLTLRSAR